MARMHVPGKSNGGRPPARSGRTSVLLTGFGPFPTVPVNATMLLVPRLARLAARVFPDVDFTAEILPTEWNGAPARLEALLDTHDPEAVLHFGVSSRARGFEIETRARNVRGNSADASGDHAAGPAITFAGPDTLPATLAASEIVARLRRRNIPANVSRDAGAYICNALLYCSLELARRRRSLLSSGFIHIPADLAHCPLRPGAHVAGSPLGWDAAFEGGLEITAACLGRASPAWLGPRGSTARIWSLPMRAISPIASRLR